MATIQIGFYNVGSTPGLNYYADPSSFTEPTRLSLVNELNSATQVEMSRTQAGSLFRGAGTPAGINLPDFADELEGTYFFSTTDTVENWTFWNMPAGTHQIVIFASRDAAPPRGTDYTFGADSGFLDAAGNLDQTLTLTHTAAEGENVVFSMARAATSQYGYINVVRLILGSPPDNKTDVIPATPYFQQSTVPYADSSYKASARPAAFAPAILRDFNSGVIGQSAQSEFNSGGAQAVYSNANMYNGTTYIDSTALANNANTFNFGGYLTLPVNLVQGDEVWIQTMIRPEDAFWLDSSPHLKFLRLREETALGANSGYNDIYMEDTTGDIKFIKEGVNTWYYAKASGTSTTPPADIGVATVAAWNRYEFYIKLHSDAGQGVVRVWKDNILILEAATKTMNNSDGYNNQVLIFTYWNGETALPAAPHTVGIENIVIGTSDSPPTNTDTDGNAFIGSYL